MKNIKVNPTLIVDTNDLNIIMSCPHCGAKSDRIIHGTKKLKCLECHKSFKKPNIIGKDSTNIKNIKTFNNTGIEQPIPLENIVPNKELNSFLDKLPNRGVPLITDFPKGNKENMKALFSSSKEIEKINKRACEITAERIINNSELLNVRENVPILFKSNKKPCVCNHCGQEMIEMTNDYKLECIGCGTPFIKESKKDEVFIKNDLPSMIELSDKIETTKIPKTETTMLSTEELIKMDEIIAVPRSPDEVIHTKTTEPIMIKSEEVPKVEKRRIIRRK